MPRVVYIDRTPEQIIRNLFTGASKIKRLRKAGFISKRPTLLEVSDIEVLGVSRNLFKLQGLITSRLALTVSKIAIDLLSLALPRTPVDTGELRESGLALVDLDGRSFGVGEGTKEGTVNANLSGISKAAKRAEIIEATVSFLRFNEDGEDIAVWTHEDLLPYNSPDHPKARTPFTGPKYLETPWLQKKDTYRKLIEKQVSESVLAKDIRRHSRIKKSKGKFTVDQVEIVQDTIAEYEY